MSEKRPKAVVRHTGSTGWEINLRKNARAMPWQQIFRDSVVWEMPVIASKEKNKLFHLALPKNRETGHMVPGWLLQVLEQDILSLMMIL